MLKRILNKLRGDRADSSPISAVFIIPLLALTCITLIDSMIFFSNRSIVQGMAHDGARTVAIMGGDGTSAQSTALERAYGLKMADTCGAIPADSIAAAAKKSSSTAIECNVMLGIAYTNSLINVKLKDVVCTPSQANSVGQRVSCKVTWEYGGVPGSALSFMKFSGEQTVMGSSESEVNLTGVPMVPRS